MSQVWKFEVATDRATFEMPEGAKLLDAKIQRERICIWALVDPKAPKVTREFFIVGTGQDLPIEPAQYVATFLTASGWLVWHLFEVVK